MWKSLSLCDRSLFSEDSFTVIGLGTCVIIESDVVNMTMTSVRSYEDISEKQGQENANKRQQKSKLDVTTLGNDTDMIVLLADQITYYNITCSQILLP